ncbi:MAG TPA: MlaD family protein [Candidatus Saccharimonadales bacterium]|jgi:phospholipid/cholesterol/gamma-HCH transport system substrate-binding protein|nr:MlaD family protein [Candidatus Saccharimonadales bacterium]
MSRTARLGAFIVVTLAILVAGVFIIGGQQYLFSSTYQLKTQFDNVAGLDVGGDVRVGGVHSGTVRTIVLPHKPGEKVTVIMDMGRSTHEIIKQDSVASIETEGLLGNQYLAITFGSAGTAEVRDGDIIASLPPLEVAGLFKKMNGILDSSQQAIQNATQATANLVSISAKIDGGKGTAGALVNDKRLYSNLEQTTSTLHTTMTQAQAGVTDFQENMEAMKHNFLMRGYFKKRGYDNSAELAKNEIERLPPGKPIKEFTYSAKQLFEKNDSAKLKNQKSLNAGGEFLVNSQFGFAVVVASTGMEGDTQKDLILTEARAMVVREYLVENFGFDDSQLRTMGIGKQPANPDAAWGTVQIFIYPEGTEIPPNKQPQVSVSAKTTVDQPVKAAAAAAKPQ